MAEKITKLTPEQESQIPVYQERYRAIGLSTQPTDRAKAEKAILAAYAHLKYKVPEIIWAESPFKGARIAAELATGSLNPTKDQVSDQASKASYGSLESYWVSFYAFIGEQLPVNKDPLLVIVQDIIEECGVYWTFEDTVVLTPKPSKIHLIDGKLSKKDSAALEYANGDALYVLDGVRYASLGELTLAGMMKNVI